MNYKICFYAIFLFIGIYILSGINFEKIMKKNKIVEAKLLIMSLGIIFSYILTNFIFDFLNIK